MKHRPLHSPLSVADCRRRQWKAETPSGLARARASLPKERPQLTSQSSTTTQKNKTNQKTKQTNPTQPSSSCPRYSGQVRCLFQPNLNFLLVLTIFIVFFLFFCFLFSFVFFLFFFLCLKLFFVNCNQICTFNRVFRNRASKSQDVSI